METSARGRLVSRLLHTLAGSELADGELLRRYADGRDEDAFTELVRRNGPLVLRVCRHVLGETTAAEDAFQATFLLLARKARRLAGTGSVAGWLHAVALRTARDARRADDRRRRREMAHGTPAPVSADDLTWREVRAHLDTELAALPEKYRLPLVLCYLQELTYEDAARRVECSVGALRGRLERGKELLRKRLARWGLTLLPPVLLLGSPSPVPAALAASALATVRAGLAGGTVTPAVARLVASSVRLKALLVASATALVAALGMVLAVGGGPVRDPPPEKEAPAPTEAAAPRTDIFGDPLPEGALLRLGTERFRHSGQIYSLACSLDGRRIATGNAPSNLNLSASVVVWDAENGRPLRRWSGHAHVVRSVAFSPDNERVVVVNGYGKVHLYDLTSGQELRRFDTESPERALFTPDGSALLVADIATVRRWDLSTGKELDPLRGHTQRIFGLAVAGDGKTIATCSFDGTVRLWDAAGRERRRLTIPKKYGLGVALSPDGERLACGTFEQEIHVWETGTGRELWRVKTDDYRVSPQSYSPDGKTLATGQDRVRLWDAATGKEVRVIECSRGAAEHVAFAPRGGPLAVGGAEATVRFWDPATGKEVRYFEGHQHGVHAGVFAPDGKMLVTASAEPFVRLWDLSTGRATRFASRKGDVRSVALAPDGKTLATSGGPSGGWPELWDLSTGRLLRRFTPSEQDFSGDGRVVFSANGRTLAAGTGSSRIRFWETATGKEQSPFAGVPDATGSSMWQSVKFVLAPDGKTVATTRGSHARSGVILWDLATGKERRALAETGVPAAFTPDGRLVAVLFEQEVRLVDASRGVEVRRVKGDQRVTCAAFSPDGRTLATAGDGRVVDLWETVTGERRERFTGHQDTIAFVAFAPDGLRIASGGEDHTVLLWNLAGGGPKGQPTEQERAAYWAVLAGSDAAAAYRAVRALASTPEQTLPLLKEHLAPVAPVEEKRVLPLLADLDGDQFEVRQRASADLEKLGPAVVPMLRKALAEGNRTAEVRRRLEEALERLDDARLSPAELRGVRAIEVLERIGSAEARQLLERLAGGVAGAPRTEDARAACRRLERR
jgi:RNA polymerase sigma factor (sigma-70 family)